MNNNSTTSLFPSNFTILKEEGRHEFTQLEDTLLRISQGVIAAFVIFSIITNAFVIRIFLSRKYGKINGAKVLYANISLSDELFLLTCIIQASTYGNQCNGNCRIVLSYATHISGFVSTYTIAFIAIRRYQAIAFPMQNRSSRSINLSLWLGIALIWILAVVMPLIFVKYVEVNQIDNSFFARICTIISSPVGASHETPLFSLIAMVLVPLVIGLIFSLLAIYSLSKSSLNSKIMGENLRQEQIAMKKRQFLRSTMMILVIITSFAVCWLPITVFYTVERLNYGYRKFCDYDYVSYAFFSCMLMAEFGANPVIYWFMNQDFRKGLSSICSFSRCRKN